MTFLHFGDILTNKYSITSLKIVDLSTYMHVLYKIVTNNILRTNKIYGLEIHIVKIEVTTNTNITITQ